MGTMRGKRGKEKKGGGGERQRWSPGPINAREGNRGAKRKRKRMVGFKEEGGARQRPSLRGKREGEGKIGGRR